MYLKGRFCTGPMSINIEKDPYQMQLLGNNLEDEIGKEVRKILDNAYMQAQQILISNRPKLDSIAELLLEKEKINEEEFNVICGDLN